MADVGEGNPFPVGEVNDFIFVVDLDLVENGLGGRTGKLEYLEKLLDF